MHSLQQLKYCKNGQTSKWKTTIQMQNVQQNLPNPTQKQQSQTPNQTTNTKNDHQRQWHTRHRTCPKHKYKHCHVSFKKTKNLLVNLNPKYTNPTSPLKTRLETDEMWAKSTAKKHPAGCGML
jgi:hypothetical protein